MAGVKFDIRLEVCLLPGSRNLSLIGFIRCFQVHAPVNGSEAYNNGVPDENFTFTISKDGYSAPVTEFLQIAEAPIEKWNFTYFEDLFARDAKAPTPVNVAAKAYRTVELYEPGDYTATLTYYNGQTTVAQ